MLLISDGYDETTVENFVNVAGDKQYCDGACNGCCKFSRVS